MSCFTSPQIGVGFGCREVEVSRILIEADFQGSHRLEKYLNLEGFLEKSLKIISALKRTEK